MQKSEHTHEFTITGTKLRASYSGFLGIAKHTVMTVASRL